MKENAMNFDITTREQNISVLHIEGKIIGSIADSFQRAMETQLEEGNKHLVIELTNVPLIDSSALGAIILTVQGFRESGGKLVLLNPQRAVRDILEVTHLASVLEIYDTEESALSAFS